MIYCILCVILSDDSQHADVSTRVYSHVEHEGYISLFVCQQPNTAAVPVKCFAPVRAHIPPELQEHLPESFLNTATVDSYAAEACFASLS